MARATREQWAKRVESWKRSGLTAEQFAGREGLCVSTLYWWSSALQRKSVASVPPVVEVVGLAVDSADASRSFELVLPNGVRVIVPAGFAAGDLRRLLAVLEAR